MQARQRSYAAFISYSHDDERWAVWLQRQLERYRDADGGHPLRPVFLDRSELAAGELSPAIEAALDASRALVVICSPSAVRSRWVAEEIQTFKRLHENPRIFPLVVEGADGAAYEAVFPEPLGYRGEDPDDVVEILAADARPGHDGRRDAGLKITAALLDVTFDSLKRRAEATRFKRLAAVAVGLSVVAVGATVLSLIAFRASQEADARRQQAEHLVTFMIGDFREELEDIGRLDLMEAVGGEALAYFESLEGEQLTAEALLQRGRAIRQIGDVRFDRGKLDSALELYAVSAQVLARAAEPRDPAHQERLVFERAQTALASSTVHYARGDVARSRADSERYRAFMAQLVDLHPDDSAYLAELAQADNNLGALAFSEGLIAEASERFSVAMTSVQSLLERAPEDADLLGQAAMLHIWLANTAERQGDDARARRHREAALEKERLTVRLVPSTKNRAALANTLTILSVENRTANADLSLGQAREAMTIYRELVEFEPANARWQHRLNRAITIAVGSELAIGCGAEVPALLAEAGQRADRLIAQDQAELEYQRDRIDIDVLGAHYAIARGSATDAESMARAAMDRALAVLRRNDRDDLSKRYFLRASDVLVRSQLIRGDRSAARVTAAEVLSSLGTMPIADPSASRYQRLLEEASKENWLAWEPVVPDDRGGCD